MKQEEAEKFYEAEEALRNAETPTIFHGLPISQYRLKDTPQKESPESQNARLTK